MAQRVKSITAEIGIDSSKFTSGANAIKRSTKDIKGNFGGLSLALTGLNSALSIATRAMDTMKNILYI